MSFHRHYNLAFYFCFQANFKLHIFSINISDSTLRTGIARAYQTATIPLWLFSKLFVEKESSGNATTANVTFIQGSSEGSMSVMPVAHALHEIGVKVTAYPAAVPNYDLAKTAMKYMRKLHIVKTLFSWN